MPTFRFVYRSKPNLNDMGTGQKYLIVDDDADDVDFFCEAIQEISSDALCYIARNGEDALHLLSQKIDALPDCIFLDLNMPLMDGKACLAELKKNDWTKDIPVIIYTTSTHSKDREATTKLGADYYLVKPTSFKKICEDISAAIKTVCAIKKSKVL